MRIKISLLLAVLLTLLSCSPDAADMGDDFAVAADTEIPRMLEIYGVPGAVVASVEEGGPVWVGAYGYASPAQGEPMEVSTVCRVESISKSVTAWAVMQLVEKGLVALDEPVLSHIDSWRFPPSDFDADAITFRQLLTHTAGLDLGTIGIVYDPRAPVPSLREQLTHDARILRSPGSSWSYSNTGYNLLELLIEEVTDMSFADYMRQEVLLPLGMEDSSFTWSEEMDIPDGHGIDGAPIAPYVYPDKASGGLFADAEDIARFISAGMPAYNEQAAGVLSAESLQKIYSPQAELTGYYDLVFDSYAMGHFVEELEGGLTAFSHGGQGTGWMTHFHMIPETGDGIVILTNSQRSWPLISELLALWADHLGIEGIGMTIIHKAAAWLRVLLTGVLVLAAVHAVNIAVGLYRGVRRFAPLAECGRIRRGFLLLAAAGLLGVSLWAAAQEYLFITSVFPAQQHMLAAASAALILVLSSAALLPKQGRSER